MRQLAASKLLLALEQFGRQVELGIGKPVYLEREQLRLQAELPIQFEQVRHRRLRAMHSEVDVVVHLAHFG